MQVVCVQEVHIQLIAGVALPKLGAKVISDVAVLGVVDEKYLT